ncbi:MAG: chromosome segregation protein SMC [Clostridia bacterium]|nr:chromosome segregation protein SMC [Clostridia bacterium]
MRLKSLELQGFKSFPDRTKLNFDAGMTVVIGPNGSGKSNIADAIRWVLGELSSKNIRGTKMEDVIFGGTDNRRPMGYAEVSLTFDNTSGEIALPVEYDEVTVTRKYYRSGDSEYMINGKNVRLKDITELFMNTGLGKSGYSIIGQGRIAEIISKKSEDRRGIFEEAAGISKYRYKKSEAERKLEKADDNLSRVTDILGELQGRVGPLEKDAEKARKYLELYGQKKEVDVGLWLYEIDSIRERTAKLQADYEISKHELEMAEDSLQSLERQSERLLQRVRENREQSENAGKEHARLTEERHAALAASLLAKKDHQHCQDEEVRLQNEIEKKDLQGKECAAMAGELQEKISLEKKTAEELQKRQDNCLDAITRSRAALDGISFKKEEADRNQEQQKEALQQLKLRLSSLEGSKSGEKERKEELEEQAEILNARIKQTGAGLLRAEEDLQSYKKKIEESKKTIEQLKSKKDILLLSQQQERDNAGKITVEQNTLLERIRLLKRMEEHFEGYAGSVRHVMTKAAEGRISGICGPVSKLISVDEQYALAIEIALGASLQHVVTEDEQAAKDAIAELKRAGVGRATFYPLSTISPKGLDVDQRKLASKEGFIGVANELVRCDKKHQKAIDYLLCRTVICDTLDHASDISAAFSRSFKIVSLDGQVINAGGSYTGGSVKKEGGILSRGAEITRLEKDKERLAEGLLLCKKRIGALEEEIRDLENEESKESSTLEILTVMLNSEDTDCKVRRAKMDSDRSQLAAVKEGLEALQDQMANFAEEKAALDLAIKQAVQALDDCKEAENAILAERSEEEDRRDRLIEQKNALTLERNFLERDLENDRLTLEKTFLQMAELQEEITAFKEQKKALTVKKEECISKERTESARHDALLKELQLLEETDGRLKQESEDFEKQSEQIRLQQKEKTRHREILLRDYTRLDGALESIKTEQERYTARLWDEYELTYAGSKELGYPEITAESKNEAVSRQNKLKNRIRDLGPVNVGAIEEYADVKERFDELSRQHADLIKARADLGEVIVSLEKEMKSRFAEIFSAINENFRKVFAELFGGGTAELSLNDPENILESGIEISVAPPGKIIKSLSLLSGGEQVFVAIALFFAILRVNPAPFCLLDEIEAALDEVNVARFASYAKNYSDKTQFIIISHRRGTMEEADTMYGVTMGERGISRVLPLHLGEVESKIGLKV